MVRAGVVVGVVLVAVGATAIIFRDRIADIVFGGVFGPPVENGNGPIVPPEGSLCIPQFEFEILCLAVSQVAQDDFNRFMQYRVDYQNLTDQSFTFDLNGQFKNQDGTVEDLQTRRQTIGPMERKQFTFNFIWTTPGLKEVNFFAWVSITNPTPLSVSTSVNTLVIWDGN